MKVTDSQVILTYCQQDNLFGNLFYFEFQKSTLPILLRPREHDETCMDPIIYMRRLACQMYWYSIMLAMMTMLPKVAETEFNQNATVGKELILTVVR